MANTIRIDKANAGFSAADIEPRIRGKIVLSSADQENSYSIRPGTSPAALAEAIACLQWTGDDELLQELGAPARTAR